MVDLANYISGISAQGIDLGSILDRASQFKANNLQMQEMRRQQGLAQQQQVLDAKFRQALSTGGLDAAFKIDPVRGQAMAQQMASSQIKQQELGIKQQEFAIKKLEAEKPRMIGSMQLQHKVLANARALPMQQRAQADNALAQIYGVDPSQITNEMRSDQAIDAKMTELGDNLSILQTPTFSQDYTKSRELAGIRPGTLATPEQEAQAQSIMRRKFEADIEGKKNKNTINIAVGEKSDLDKTVKREAQQEVYDSGLLMQQIADIRSINPARFLTTQGRLALKAAKLGSYAGSDFLSGASKLFTGDEETGKKFIQDSVKLRQSVNNVFNKYRKLITGAGASEKELESLKDAILNVDLGPEEFDAAVDQLEMWITRGLEARGDMLRQGAIDLPPEGISKARQQGSAQQAQPAQGAPDQAAMDRYIKIRQEQQAKGIDNPDEAWRAATGGM